QLSGDLGELLIDSGQLLVLRGALLVEVARARIGLVLGHPTLVGINFGPALLGDQLLGVADRLQSEQATHLAPPIGRLERAEERKLLLAREEGRDEGFVL